MPDKPDYDINKVSALLKKLAEGSCAFERFEWVYLLDVLPEVTKRLEAHDELVDALEMLLPFGEQESMGIWDHLTGKDKNAEIKRLRNLRDRAKQ